ncbi:fibronectin type III domain-containing protein [Flavobacterium psychrophilum]
MIRNLYKIVFLFLSFQIFGQVYPVQITPIFNTPYSSRISDYATSMDVKMQLLINPSDISITNRQVRLKMYLQGNNINAQSVDYVNGINPIYINGGELLTLTNLDLAALFRLENLQGITPVQYANALPEGMYNVCFELYDFATNQRISQKSCAYLYLMLNDPPLLNTPAKNESIAVSDFPNILFTWTPRQLNATNVSYEFEIKEILDPTIDPQIGFLTSPTLYDETLYSTALLYDSSKPNLLAGKRYAWRVRAMSTSGLSLNNVFKNDGYSEIHHFTYASNCPAPTFILSEALSARSVRISWQGDNSHTKYHLQYKKANVSRAEWFEVYTMNTQTTLTDLEAGVTYEFRVGGSCEPAVLGNRASFTYSGINNFTLPAVGTTSSSFTCGLNPAVAIANQTPITNLIVTETFTAGDFPVKILELTGNNPYNGKGYIIVPYLADTKIAVVFNNITINTNYQLINGIVETSYNPQAPNINDLEDLTGGNNGVIITQTISFVITTVTTNPNGDIIVSGANGEQIAIPGGSNTVITGTTATGGTGSIYNVDSQGNVTGPFMPAPGGATTPQNTDGVATNGQTTQFAAQGLTIAFEPTTATKYSWDIVPDTAPTYIKDKYAKIGSAYLPYKAVVNGQSDVLKTKITLADATIVLDSIVFKTQHGVLLDKVKQGNDYMLTLKGTQTYGEEEVQAVIKQGGKYKVAGAFRLVHVSEKPLNITLIPLNNTTSIPSNAISDLQTNYEKAGVKLTIKIAPVLMYDGEADAKITTSDSGLFDYYTDEEKSINAKIKALPEYNNKTYYLIYSNLPSDKGIEGFMALGGQFGYVFPNAGGKTAPHELAHGVFALQHPFITDGDKGKTSFLMDYGSGTELWHTDWAQINNPALKFYGFQNSSDGEYSTNEYITDITLDNLNSFTESEVPFLTPTGEVIKLKKEDFIDISFYSNGTLNTFTKVGMVSGERYIATVNKNDSQIFLGYSSDVKNFNETKYSFIFNNKTFNYAYIVQKSTTNSCKNKIQKVLLNNYNIYNYTKKSKIDIPSLISSNAEITEVLSAANCKKEKLFALIDQAVLDTNNSIQIPRVYCEEVLNHLSRYFVPNELENFSYEDKIKVIEFFKNKDCTLKDNYFSKPAERYFASCFLKIEENKQELFLQTLLTKEIVDYILDEIDTNWLLTGGEDNFSIVLSALSKYSVNLTVNKTIKDDIIAINFNNSNNPLKQDAFVLILNDNKFIYDSSKSLIRLLVVDNNPVSIGVYDNVIVNFLEPLTYKGVKFEGKKIMPALFFYLIANEKVNVSNLATANIVVDVASVFSGGILIKKLYQKTGKTIIRSPKFWRHITGVFLASANITFNTVLVNKLEGTEFLEYWNTINLLYGITDIGLNINDFIRARNQAKLRLTGESSEINTTFDEIANDLQAKVVVSGAGNAIPNLLNKVDNVENAIVSVAKNEAEILDELVKTNNTVTENAKKFWAQHEMNVTSHLETTYGSTKVGQQITVDIYIQGSTTPVRCRIDNLIDVGGGKFRIADGKSSIINDLSVKTPEQLLNSMSTVNQKTFYDALKNGTVTQIKPAGARAQTFLGNLNPIQVEKSIDFFVNDVSTNGYSMFKKTLIQ